MGALPVNLGWSLFRGLSPANTNDKKYRAYKLTSTPCKVKINPMVAALLTTTTTTTHHPITHSKARVSIRCRFKKLTFCCCSFYPRLCKYRTMKHVWYSIVQSRIYLCVCIINLYSRGCYIISHLWIDTK